MDNYVSFNRFTSLNPNIAQHGATVEELVRSRGTPDPNPTVAPMADPGISETRLALASQGSDRMRLSNPAQPQVNPYEGPTRTLTASRNAVTKLRGQVLQDLEALIHNGAVGTQELRARMADSIQRVSGMRDFVNHLNGMAEAIVARSVGAAKP